MPPSCLSVRLEAAASLKLLQYRIGTPNSIRMTDLLPKTTTDFTDPQYWKRFFAQRKTPFEWYGDYSNLGPVLEKYLKSSDRILQIGCGNSLLASQMFDSGFRQIHSVDVDEAVVAEQRRRNKDRVGLTFDKDNATQLSSGDETVSVVVDKGTLDALLPPSPSAEQAAVVTSMFREVTRVLQTAGRYIIITLAQEHLVQFWMDHFMNSKQFLLRAHEVPTTASGFPMPVFFLVATKLRAAMPMAMPVELLRVGSEKADRLCSPAHLIPMVAAEQELSRFIHLCSSKLDGEVSIDIEGKHGGGPRYRLHIVDDAKAKELKSFGVFVVPVGRDGDWIFATEKGRRALRLQIEKDRLVVVFLFRDQEYASLDQVKDELSGFVARFDPCAKGFDIMSVGATDVRRSVASGQSAVNGEWAVEDVTVAEEQQCRRLVFLASQNLVQSEAPLKAGRKGKMVVDLDSLSCDHHNLMLSAFALLPKAPLSKPESAELKIAVLGLGGGLLAAYVLRRFSKSRVTGVELDAAVVRIGQQHFSFPSDDPRMDVRVMDARLYLEELADDDAKKVDVLLVDVAGSMHEDGLSCPPACFLERKVLEDMRRALRPDGLVALNLVTRDDVVADRARRSVRDVFPHLYTVSSDEDVNEVLLGVNSDVSIGSLDGRKLSKGLPRSPAWVSQLAESVARIRPVVA